jgi:hypothetical protein
MYIFETGLKLEPLFPVPHPPREQVWLESYPMQPSCPEPCVRRDRPKLGVWGSKPQWRLRGCTECNYRMVVTLPLKGSYTPHVYNSWRWVVGIWRVNPPSSVTIGGQLWDSSQPARCQCTRGVWKVMRLATLLTFSDFVRGGACAMLLFQGMLSMRKCV